MRNVEKLTHGSKTIVKIQEYGPRTIRFPLTNGAVFEMQVNKPISRADFDRIKELVILSEETFCDQKKIGFVLPGSDKL